ncbi:MAG: preprotein translocase subunit SecG [Alphaproteobacteria bacterium]|nr:preprotein translocase subunit SecG [Alphaproteobacteria bacterium]
MYTVLLVAHTILVLFLIGMVLLQRTDSDGLSGLGGGGNQFMTGRAKGNLMTRATAILAALFMTTSLVLAIMAGHMTNSSIVDSVENAAPSAVEEAPAEPAKPAAPAVPKSE